MLRYSPALKLCLVMIVLMVSIPALSIAIENLSKPELRNDQSLVRVYFPSKKLAQKAAISYHHALLASPYERGYLVMQLSEYEKQELANFGFIFKPAPDYQAKMKLMTERLQTATKSSNANAIPGFPCYDTVEGTYDAALDMVDNYPSLATWIDIGDSWEKTSGIGGYDLRVLKLTNNAIQKIKPILFVHSAMHAREYATAPLALAFARQLLDGYDRNADITWILDHHEIHLMLHMNPDGRKQAENGQLWRKNTNQAYCTTDALSRGADLNRNFSFFWNTAVDGSSGDECDATFRGPAPASEPETQAVEAYIRSIFVDNRGPNINDAAPLDTPGMHIDIHSFSQLVLWPWGHLNTPAPNGPQLQTLGRKLAFFNNYAPIQSVGLYPTDGTSDDISYGELGVAALTLELGTEFFEDCSVFENQIKNDNLPALSFAAKIVSAPYQLSAGPDVYDLKINNNASEEVFVSGDFVLSALVSDTRFSTAEGTETTQNIKAVEYYLDVPPFENNNQERPMSAADGIYDAKTEAVEATISITGLSNDRHILYLRAQDQDDNWGPVSAVFVNLGVPPANQSPVAAFTYGCNGTTCDFDAGTSTDTDGNISNFQWDFGDGSTSGQGQQISHSYATSGSYSVTLTVTDDDNATADTITSVAVQAPATQPPPSGSSGGGGVMSWIILMLLSISRLGRKKASIITTTKRNTV